MEKPKSFIITDGFFNAFFKVTISKPVHEVPGCTDTCTKALLQLQWRNNSSQVGTEKSYHLAAVHILPYFVDNFWKSKIGSLRKRVCSQETAGKIKQTLNKNANGAKNIFR